MQFAVNGEIEPDRFERLKDRTERYCVVLQTLLSRPAIDAAWTITADAPSA